jgi:predicted RNA binding protein YcfA (HicA-like mRNA interferase family)
MKCLPSDENPLATCDGRELVAALYRHWGYEEVNQVGSHIIVQTEEPTPHRVAVPAHKSVRVGTLNGILRAVANHKGVDRQAILETL